MLQQSKPTKADEALAAALGAVANLNDNARQLVQGLKTYNGARRLGAESRIIAGGQSGRLSNSPGRLAGYALRETAGAAAVVRLLDGPDANGDMLLSLSLAANESTRDWYLPGGISFTQGLFVVVVSGAIEGNVYLGTSL